MTAGGRSGTFPALMRLAPVLLLLPACGLFGGGSKQPAAGVPVVRAEVALECKAGSQQWSASLASSKADKCAFHDGEGLEVRIGTLEGGLRIVAGDFQGTGQYPTGVNGGKVELTAKGGPEGTTTTLLDSEGSECKSQCMVDVTASTVKEAEIGGSGLVSLVVKCPSLARKDGKTCVECKAKAETILEVKDLPCQHVKD